MIHPGSLSIRFLLLLAALFCFACKQNDQPDTELFLPGPMKNGSMHADKTALEHNTVKWAGSGWARRDSLYYEDANGTIVPYVPPRISIGAGTSDEFGQRRESLEIAYLPMGVGKYLLHEGRPDYGLPRAGYARVISDGDVLGAYYRPETDGKSWVEITQIDTVEKVVRGNFEIYFKVGENYLDRGFPASIQFSKGTFDVKIID